MRDATTPGGLAERPVLSNGHAGCGGRVRDTDRPKDRYCALARPYVPWVRISGADMRKRCGKPAVRGLNSLTGQGAQKAKAGS